MTDEGMELVITLMEAKDLIGPSNADDEFDTFVRIYLVPDDQAPLQTKVSAKSINFINMSPLSTNYDNQHRLNSVVSNKMILILAFLFFLFENAFISRSFSETQSVQHIMKHFHFGCGIKHEQSAHYGSICFTVDVFIR